MKDRHRGVDDLRIRHGAKTLVTLHEGLANLGHPAVFRKPYRARAGRVARDPASHQLAHEGVSLVVNPWRRQMWCIPPKQDAAFVCSMEQVLDVYTRPHDPARPVVCMRIVSRIRIGQVGSFSIRCYRHGTIDGKCGAQHNAGIAVEDMHAPSCVGWRSQPEAASPGLTANMPEVRS